MARPSKTQKLLAKALDRRGIWYASQITITARDNGNKRVCDFILKPTIGRRKLIVEISDDRPDSKTFKRWSSEGYKLEQYTPEQVTTSPKLLVQHLIQAYKPVTKADNNRVINAELREVKQLLVGVKMKKVPAKVGNLVSKS